MAGSSKPGRMWNPGWSNSSRPAGPGWRRADCPWHCPQNRDVLARAGVVEIHGRLDDALIGSLSRGHGEHMIPRRAVAHFAVDSALCKFEVVPRKRIGLDAAQLAGMARRATGLIIRRRRDLIEARYHGARRTRRIDYLPIVDPPSLDRAVLNRKYVDVARRQPSRIGLLPLRPDGVIHRVGLP